MDNKLMDDLSNKKEVADLKASHEINIQILFKQILPAVGAFGFPKA